MLLSTSPLAHTTLINRDDISDICAPLFRNTPISHFDYSCYYKDDSYIVVSPNPSFDSAYITLRIQPTFNEIDFYNQGLAYYSPSVPPILKAKKFTSQVQLGCDFNISNRVYIINKYPDYYETCGFALPDSCSHLSLPAIILNELDLFKNFILYFREKAQDHLSVLSRNRLSTPMTIENTLIKSESTTAFDFDALKKDIALSSYSVISNGITISLTQREVMCLQLLKNNVTSKVIANRLGISHRTVDTHLNNIKVKAGCSFETDLINIAKENNL
jgi:LuxR family quorum-sensing system transcriptional regulator SolR